MKKLKFNKAFIVDIVLVSIFLFVLEVIFRLIENYSLVSYSTLRIFLSSFLITIVWNFIFFFPNNGRKQHISNLFLIFIMTIYCFAQAGFINFIGIYMSFGTSTQLGAVTTYIKEFVSSFKVEYYLLLSPLILYIFYLSMPRKLITREKIKSLTIRGQMLITFIIICGLYYSTLVIPFMQNPLQLVANKELIANPNNAGIAINQFGTSLYGILDVKSIIFPYEYGGEYLIDEVSHSNKTRKIDDTAWQELIKNTTNPTYKSLNNYFINQPITEKNEYTGLLKDKNLIVIMMESVNTVINNSEYFPNFAKMLNNGWYFENNYSPRNSCATINNEVSGLTSLFSINNVCTGNVYKENTYFESMFGLFGDAGYYPTSYHDYTEEYYARHDIHTNMGAIHHYDYDDIYTGPDYADWPSDAEFIYDMVPKFIDEDKFFVWYTTVTPHQPYTNESHYGMKYYDLFEETNYSDTIKHYLSKVKVTDDALGNLMEELEKKDKLKDTVIVLYGDHYPYALKDEDLKYVVDYNISEGYEREKTPLLIYNPSLESKVFSMNTTYMNILPTLANLFDINYDPRLYFGVDALSSEYDGRIILSDGSWQDSIARYNAITSTVTYYGNEEYTLEELSNINKEVINKIEMSNLAITSNYFHYLENGLKEYQKGEDND